MRKEDLVIGKRYKCEPDVVELYGISERGIVVLIPIEGCGWASKYDSSDEEYDAVCKDGLFGHTIGHFLSYYEEV